MILKNIHNIIHVVLNYINNNLKKLLFYILIIIYSLFLSSDIKIIYTLFTYPHKK